LIAAFSASALHALLLALAIFVSAKAAMEFVGAGSVRGIIAMGVSLAAVQIVSPSGIVVSAIVAPALAASQPSRPAHGRNTGLLLLLLFMPLASAAILAYLAREFRFEPWAYMASPFDHLLPAQIFDNASPRRSGAINSVAMAAAAFPIWWMAPRSRRAGLVAVVASALVAAVALAALMQRSYSFGAFVPALSTLSLLAISELRDSPNRAKHAIMLCVASVAVSWLFLTASL
jgi:hypothetical protein